MKANVAKSDALWHEVSGHASAAVIDSPPVQICLLGSPRILVDGRNVADRIKYRKGIALLSLLVVDDDVKHPRERVANLFWPDLSRASALTNLRQVISNLSRVLTPASGTAQSVLDTDSGHVGLFPKPHLSVDVHALRASTSQRTPGSAAASVLPPLHRFLEGFDLPDCLEYSSWLENQRCKLDADIISLHEKAIARAMARQDPEGALVHARLIERIDPLQELNQVCLMRLLMESGRPNQALVQYERFAARLRNELDVEPEPATQALQQHILQRASSSHSPSTRPKWRFDNAVNATVMYLTCDAEPDDAHGQCSEETAVLTHEVLREHSHRVINSLGLGQFAFFDAEHEGPDHGNAAIQAACAVMATLACAPHMRIGIYSARVSPDSGPGHARQLAEAVELARRLGFIADGGDIIVCADTVGKLALDVEYLGTWRFRGICQEVHAFRLDGSS